MNRKVGLFGILIHAIIVAVFLLSRNLRGERISTDIVLVAIPLLLFSSFIVYTVVVSRYVQRREGSQKSIIIDSLMGIMAEYMIFTLAAVLFGLYDGLWNRHGSETGFGKALLTGVMMNILWVYATFMVQVLVLGNLCGLVGWLLLRKSSSGR